LPQPAACVIGQGCGGYWQGPEQAATCKAGLLAPPESSKTRNPQEACLRNLISGALAACLVAGTGAAMAEEVGKVGVDWLGNDIIVEAIKDPKVEGVTCHVSYFDRGVIDRLQKGNWFEDPSDSSISCRQTGPIIIGDIDTGEGGEEVFKQGISLIWKKQVVNRIYDKTNETLIYLSHSRQVQDGSAKMSVTTVPLYGQNVVWSKGKPQ
jgi:CreA protein